MLPVDPGPHQIGESIMSKASLILIVALQVGMAGAALAAPKQYPPAGVSSQDQAQMDRTGPARGGEP